MTWYVLTRRAGTPCAAGRVRTPERLLHEAEADAPVTARSAWRNRIDATSRHSAARRDGCVRRSACCMKRRRTHPSRRATHGVTELTRQAGTPLRGGTGTYAEAPAV